MKKETNQLYVWGLHTKQLTYCLTQSWWYWHVETDLQNWRDQESRSRQIKTLGHWFVKVWSKLYFWKCQYFHGCRDLIFETAEMKTLNLNISRPIETPRHSETSIILWKQIFDEFCFTPKLCLRWDRR
jgi:hypothetical protein